MLPRRVQGWGCDVGAVGRLFGSIFGLEEMQMGGGVCGTLNCALCSSKYVFVRGMMQIWALEGGGWNRGRRVKIFCK